MSRDLSTNVGNAVAAPVVAPAFLCEMDFATGSLRTWTGTGVLEWAGRSFTGTGTHGNISEVEESQKVSANGVELSLSGIPSDMISRVLGEGYRGRVIRLWMALFDTATAAMLNDPIPVLPVAWTLCAFRTQERRQR